MEGFHWLKIKNTFDWSEQMDGRFSLVKDIKYCKTFDWSEQMDGRFSLVKDIKYCKTFDWSKRWMEGFHWLKI